MKRYLLFSLFALIVGCKGQITEEKAESSPTILTLEQQSEILQKHTIVQDQQYVLTLSRFDAVLQGVSQELYEKKATSIEAENAKIKEMIALGYRIEFPITDVSTKSSCEHSIVCQHLILIGTFENMTVSSCNIILPHQCLNLLIDISGYMYGGGSWVIVSSADNTTTPIYLPSSGVYSFHWHWGNVIVTRCDIFARCNIYRIEDGSTGFTCW